MKRILILLIAVIFASAVPAQPATLRFADRLERLAPDDPLAYFELAEDVTDVAGGIEDTRLAQRLYVLALSLSLDNPRADREAGFPIAASSCLGLAALERSDDRQRWLRALAGRLDARYAIRRWDVPERSDQNHEVPLLAAEAIGLVLSGDGALARDRLDDPRVAALLDRTRDVLDRPGTKASLTALMQEAQIWPCPECGNVRAVPDRNEGGRARRLCSTCRGNPGPVLDDQSFAAYISYQSVLLQGVQHSWSAELAVGGGKPLIDPEPEEVAPAYEIDPAKVYFRFGQWTASPDGLEQDASGG
ncbi:MAG TPA: hypothetical protein ENJ00_09990 [Phycisphaerales bacterium]|nr:hypothetical protein [Phycisphaerales bacterium]